MNYIDQQKEIETIKERTIKLSLSDADCNRLSIKAGLGGQTISELLENFIGDLVNGTYSNGSDERNKANEWYNRCEFSRNDSTLLQYLLEHGYDISDFIITCDELKCFETSPREFDDEVAELEDGEKLWFQDGYQEYVGEFLDKYKDVEIEKEISLCRKWMEDSKVW